MNHYFVDRNTETAALRQFARSVATAVRPRGALIDGDSGIGKSALLADLAASRAELPVDLYIVRCLPRIGPTAAFDAVANLFAQTEAKAQRRIRLRKRTAVGVSAGGQLLALVAQSIPHAGQFITSATGAVRATLDSGSMPFDSLAPFERALDLKVAEVLTERLRRRSSVVVIDDLHYCDERSLFVFDQLLRQDRCPRLGLIFARDDHHPAGKNFARLTDTWHRDGLIERRELLGLPPEAVTDLVSLWFPGAPPDLARELARVTEGHPAFLTRTLESLDPTAPVLRVPESLRDLVGEQLDALPDGGGDLLVLAAIQGFWFDSATVAELSGLDRAAVRDQLHTLARSSRLIEAVEPPEWARRERADHYRFQHQALWEVVHGSQSDERRREGHERVALAALDRLVDRASHEQRLDIAAHLRLAEDHCWGLSSEYHLALAHDAAAKDLSLSSAEWLCGEAIDAAQRMPEGEPGRDRRLIRSALFYLSLTEVRWKGLAQPTGQRDTDSLAADAEAAERRLADPALLVRATMMRGKTLMATAGLESGLERLENAVRQAQQLPDPVALYIARIEYGRQVSKRNLETGVAELEVAERMRTEDARIRDGSDPVLVHARNLGEIQYAVSLFDAGRLGEARERLEAAVHRLRAEQALAELPIALNYLAQLRICLGDLEGAEAALLESLRLEEDRGGESGWHAYNTALLGAVHALRGAPATEVLAEMSAAWQETRHTWLLNLVPIVRNLYAYELFRAGMLDSAERHAGDTVKETEQSGMVRSKIAAHMLLGRIHLAAGRLDAACVETDHSLALLQEHGTMPALRNEEVYYHAAVVFTATGRREQAGELLELARDELGKKERTIPDEPSRARFRDAPGLNLWIRDGEGVAS